MFKSDLNETAFEQSRQQMRFDLCRVFRVPVRFLCSPEFPVNEKINDAYCLMLLWFFDGGWKGDRRPSAW